MSIQELCFAARFAQVYFVVDDIQLSYNVYVRTTITVRTDSSLRAALLDRAETQGKTLSELVREILEGAVLDRPLGGRIGHLKVRLSLSSSANEDWRKRLRDRNWRS